MAEEFGYSLDGELYHGRFSTREEAAVHIGCRIGWTGRYVPYQWRTDDLSDVVIERMQERAYNDVGEASDDGFPITAEQQKQLDADLSAFMTEWIERNGLQPRFSLVDDVEVHPAR